MSIDIFLFVKYNDKYFIGENMKKLIAFVAIILIVSALLAGCGSSYVPLSTMRWANNETLTYNVRRASDFELNYIGITGITNDEGVFVTPYLQIIPSQAEGTYTTTVTYNSAENTYTVVSTLNVTEVYTKNLFEGKTDLYNDALTKAADSDIMSVEGEDIIVDVTVTSQCTFKEVGMLPISSSKTVKSVFIGCGTCTENDFATVVTYDYSKKKPIANVTTTADGETTENSVKLKSGVKTFDNEQIEFLLRSFNISPLAEAGGAALNIFAGTESSVKTMNAIVPKGYAFDYQIGGVWKDIGSDGKQVYYKEGENYTDINGNVVETLKRKVSIVGLNGTNLIYYYDSEPDTSIETKQVLIRMQQSYLVFDVTQESLSLV
jgi:hypothetical protein